MLERLHVERARLVIYIVSKRRWQNISFRYGRAFYLKTNTILFHIKHVSQFRQRKIFNYDFYILRVANFAKIHSYMTWW